VSLENSKLSIEHSGCPLECKASDERVILAKDILHDFKGEFAVVRCSGCGLMRTDPRPTQQSMGAYYPEDYRPYVGTYVNEYKKKRMTFLRKIFKIFLDDKSQILPEQKPGKMLEVGCASGSFLRKMSDQGWSVEGIEFSQKPAEEARKLGYKVHIGSLERAPKPEGLYNLIVGWMVLEHLHQPLMCLKKLRGWADKDAWLVLSIPNARSFEFRLFKTNWYALQVPTHLYHYTPESLAKILLASGWKLEKIHYQRSVRNIFASLGLLIKQAGAVKLGEKMINIPWWLDYFFFPISIFLSVIGQTGRMTIWAKPVSRF
jgi:2-polyprenyl-3-methyl-5-hydroxy-6-metoxy-1,4-benzoquinol methylase